MDKCKQNTKHAIFIGYSFSSIHLKISFYKFYNPLKVVIGRYTLSQEKRQTKSVLRKVSYQIYTNFKLWVYFQREINFAGVYVSVCMHVFVCIRVYTYVGQRLMLDVLVYASFFERWVFPEPGASSSVQLGWLGSHPGSSFVFLCCTWVTEAHCFYVGAWDLNSGPHVFMTNITPTEPYLLCP